MRKQQVTHVPRRQVEWGVPELDKAYGRMGTGEVHVVGARAGIGKTTFALGRARYWADKGEDTLYIQAELTDAEMLAQILASELGLQWGDIRYSALTPDQQARWDWHQENTLDRLRLAKPEQLMAKAGEVCDGDLIEYIGYLIRSGKFVHVVVDYVQRLAEIAKRRRESKMDAIARLMRTLEDASRDGDVHVLALSQLNREGERLQHAPSMDHFEGSGSIEQSAWGATILARRFEENEVPTGITLRNGKDETKLVWEPVPNQSAFWLFKKRVDGLEKIGQRVTMPFYRGAYGAEADQLKRKSEARTLARTIAPEARRVYEDTCASTGVPSIFAGLAEEEVPF